MFSIRRAHPHVRQQCAWCGARARIRPRPSVPDCSGRREPVRFLDRYVERLLVEGRYTLLVLREHDAALPQRRLAAAYHERCRQRCPTTTDLSKDAVARFQEAEANMLLPRTAGSWFVRSRGWRQTCAKRVTRAICRRGMAGRNPHGSALARHAGLRASIHAALSPVHEKGPRSAALVRPVLGVSRPSAPGSRCPCARCGCGRLRRPAWVRTFAVRVRCRPSSRR